jgi:subtilase family protein/pre-peptidase
MARRFAALLAAALLLSALLPEAAGAASPTSKLTKEDRATVLRTVAEAGGPVRVLIAYAPGQGNVVADGIRALGGTVEYREDSVNYLRASVPAGKADAASALAGVKGFELDKVIPVPDVRPDPEAIAPLIPGAPPSAATPRANPYMPTQDTGAAQFVDAHPTWDGRGVTIGIVDTGQSLDHPSLLTTSTGERKIIDWVTGTDPLTEPDPTWLNMADQYTASPTFVFGTGQTAVTYTAPSSGTFRFNVFREDNPLFGGEYSAVNTAGGDLNRDGDETDVFGILWDTTANTVWVDTNLNRSFADETGMTDYKVNYDVGWIGTDNPATAVHETVPFVVQTDGKNKFVNLGIVSGFHGSHVAGIAAGNSLFGGSMSGAAPGAKIVSLRACLFVAGCTSHALLEGMIFVAKQSNVDVINMSIGGLPALNDGNNTRCLVYDSLIETYNVQMFLSQGNNGPGVNTAGDPGVCGKAMGLGAYLTDETMLADYGQDVNYDDNLHLFSSRGPREDGGFKPNAVAPGAAVSSAPLWQAGVGLPYALPPGYQLANGTSMASPQAAGLAAVLVSAANAEGIQHQPAQIRQALMSTARYLDSDRFQAYDQGVGLLDIAAAWDVLQEQPKTASITSSVEVNTILEGFLATPGKGQGIYDREGVTKGQNYTRTYTFRRTSGGGGSTAYNVSWLGNDGTFSSAGSISLPKNVGVQFSVGVAPSEYGAHSAVLRLDDPTNPGIEYQTMNTVIVPYDFVAPDYTASVSGTIDIAQAQHFFFRVPTGVPALKVDMVGGGTAAGAGQLRFLRWHPFGQAIDDNAVSNCYNPPAAAGCATGSPTSRTSTNPQAGVWEVSVDTRRTSDADDAPFTLTATILGAAVSPNPDTIASATIGVPVARSYTLTNLFGAFTGRAVGTALGSARIARPTIANLAQQRTDVTIPAGSTSFRATINNASDPAADLDLFVFNCTTGTCVLAGQNADGDSNESVTIANPAAGRWQVLVDGFAVPSGSTQYDYIDVYANPMFGSVAVTDANALRPAGSAWTVPGSVTANANPNIAPDTGRVLFGNVQVRTDTNILIGSGDVIVQAVTP